ncbi:hypothetical protein [Brunnivagina elsteri]|uniref:hypothetical protein n=1 Tax=Brunnivagina elsteri TaxID=1247191 RepID=UPI00117838AC|nr:hypothetical protein [Calothrix elsteri]
MTHHPNSDRPIWNRINNHAISMGCQAIALQTPRGDNPNKTITIFILPGHPSHNFLTMRENEIDPSPKSRSLTWEHHKQSSISTEKSRETRSQGKRSHLHISRGGNPNKTITIFILPGHLSHNFLTIWENEVDSSPK